MNEVELAQKMIMNYFQGTLKNDFTAEQKEILETVFQKVKIEYAPMREELEDDAGEYNREEEKIVISNKNKDKKQYIQTLIHEYGHALSNFDFYKTGIHTNPVIEEGMVELLKDLVIDFNKHIDIEAYDTYKDETAITRTVMAGLHESKKDISVIAKYFFWGTDKEKSGFLEEAFGESASKINPLEDENIILGNIEMDSLYRIVADSFKNKNFSDKIPNIYTKNNPLLIFCRVQDIIPDIMDVYFSEKEVSGKVECHQNSIDEYIISKAILRNLKNSLEKCKTGKEVIEVYQNEEKKLQECLQIASETNEQGVANYGCKEILQILRKLPLESGRYSTMDLVMQLPPQYEDFEKIAELLQGEGFVDNESIFMIDQYQYTELMNAVNNESVKEEAEYNEPEQEKGITLTPEQRKESFLRSRKIYTQMALEAQEQVYKDIREQQQEKDRQGKDISEN